MGHKQHTDITLHTELQNATTKYSLLKIQNMYRMLYSSKCYSNTVIIDCLEMYEDHFTKHLFLVVFLYFLNMIFV